MRYTGLVLFVMVINTCATSTEVNTTEGKAGHTVYCSGSANSWETCNNKASEICGMNKYDVLQQYEDEGAFAAYQSAAELPDRRLIIQCKE